MDRPSLSPPPRHVPWNIWLTILDTSLFIVPGAFVSLFLGVMIPIALGHTDFGGGSPFSRNRGESQAASLTVTQTNLSICDTSVYQYDYTFTLADAQVMPGRSYATGHIADEKNPTVEYVLDDPQINRLRGTRTRPFTPGVVLVTIAFLAVFTVPPIIAVRQTLRKVRLLRDGEVAEATITSITAPGGKEVSGQAFRKQWASLRNLPFVQGRCSNASIAFEFSLPDGDVVQATDMVTLTDRIVDEPAEPILYDPLNPKRAFLLDGLPAGIRLTDDGEWQSDLKTGSLIRFALLPVAAAAGYLFHCLLIGGLTGQPSG